MALDKLIDSTALDAALGYTADRIRLKTGGSAELPFDMADGKGFGEAVDAIQSGGGNELRFYMGSSLVKVIKIYIPSLTTGVWTTVVSGDQDIINNADKILLLQLVKADRYINSGREIFVRSSNYNIIGTYKTCAMVANTSTSFTVKTSRNGVYDKTTGSSESTPRVYVNATTGDVEVKSSENNFFYTGNHLLSMTWEPL